MKLNPCVVPWSKGNQLQQLKNVGYCSWRIDWQQEEAVFCSPSLLTAVNNALLHTLSSLGGLSSGFSGTSVLHSPGQEADDDGPRGWCGPGGLKQRPVGLQPWDCWQMEEQEHTVLELALLFPLSYASTRLFPAVSNTLLLYSVFSSKWFFLRSPRVSFTFRPSFQMVSSPL